MTESFKQIYDANKDAPLPTQEEKKLVKEYILQIPNIIKPIIDNESVETVETVETVEIVEAVEDNQLINIDTDIPVQAEEIPHKEQLTEEMIKDVLENYEEKFTKLLESVIEDNIKLTDSAEKTIKSNIKMNKKLINDIATLMEKVEKVETKLDTLAATPLTKKIHRDSDGLVTYISESFDIPD